MKNKLASLAMLALLSACTSSAPVEPAAEANTEADHVKASVQDEVSVPSVADVQKSLNHKGAKVKVDGRMGPKTKEAVKVFQAKNKLKVTGIADEETLKKLGLM